MNMMHEALKRKMLAMKQGGQQEGPGMLEEAADAHPDPAGPAPMLEGHEGQEDNLLQDLQMHQQASADDIGQLQAGQGAEMQGQEEGPGMEEILQILADRKGGSQNSLGSRVAMGAKDKMASMMKSKR